MKRIKKQKMLSKIIALGLAVIMAMAMGITAFAAITPDEKATITVNNLEAGDKVSAYKIIEFHVSADGQPQDPVYIWNAEVASWLRKNEAYKIYVGENNDNKVTDEYQKLATDSAALKTLNHDLAYAIKKGNINLQATKTDENVTGNSVDLTELTMGQYLLTVKGVDKIYTPTTVNLFPNYENSDWALNSATVNMKGEKPTITKSVDGDRTVNIGDEVTYTLNVLVPEYPEDAAEKVFNVGDKLGSGLTLVPGTIKVELVKADSTTEDVTAADNYTLDTDGGRTESNTDYTFQVEFKSTFLGNVKYAGKTIKVTYKAKVKNTAFEGTNPLKNVAFLGYNTDPYDATSYKEKSDEKVVYTYGITVNKVKEDGAVLNDAEFELKKGNTVLKFTQKSDGVYVYDATSSINTLSTGKNGNTLQLQGLDTGTYTLTETKAPSGYILPNGTITITINDKEPDGQIDEGSTAEVTGTVGLFGNINITDDTRVIEFNVVNEDGSGGFNLPKTGGAGTVMFTILGILLMGGAVTLLVVSKKKRHMR